MACGMELSLQGAEIAMVGMGMNRKPADMHYDQIPGWFLAEEHPLVNIYGNIRIVTPTVMQRNGIFIHLLFLIFCDTIKNRVGFFKMMRMLKDNHR